MGDLPFRRGDAIDRFTVLELLGMGGTGVVVSAYDCTLDRKVAIKVLRPDRLARDPEEGRARLLREAQAMARLQHRNVITVYEVGTVGEQVFVAMELVEGETLAAWLRRAPRPWREIVRMFVRAGWGLAAAHRAGLVHRDFKPDNVLVSSDGEVRVTDFGLASVAADVAGQESADVLSVSLTRTGTVLGTPAYMSPEQHRSEDADARSDQFSFCVSLYEALYGVRPFAGDTDKEVLQAIAERRLRAPSRTAPRQLRSLVLRGLEPRPDDRWPSLDALLHALARDPAVARRKWLVGGALAVVVAGAGGQFLFVARDPCPAPDGRVAAVWGKARAAEVGARLVALDPDHGRARLAAAERAVVPFARAWLEMHLEACRATRIRGEQSDRLLDLRMRCLNRRLAELDGSIGLLASAANRAELDGALAGLLQLSPLDGCADQTAVAREWPAPVAPAARARADALAKRVQKIEIEVRAGRLVGLRDQAEALVADARRLDDPPTLAAALAALARVRVAVLDSPAAETALRELIAIAARAHEDPVEAFAWIELLTVVGVQRRQPDRALLLVPAANAAVARAGDPLDLRVDLLLAEVLLPQGGVRAADDLERLQQARRMLETAGAERPGSLLAHRLGSVLSEIGRAQSWLGDQDASLASYRQAIERWRTMYGEDSLAEAATLQTIGGVLIRKKRLDEALAAVREAARISEARTGQSARLASTFVAMGSVLRAQGDWEGALERYDRALSIQRTLFGADDVQFAAAILNRANVLTRLGRFAEASRGYDELIALLERARATTTTLPLAYFNRGGLARQRGRCADALADYGHAIGLYEQELGAKHVRLVVPLVDRGRCLVQTARHAEAIAVFDRALAIEAEGDETLHRTLAQAWRGHALVASGRDRASGRAQARAATSLLADLAKPDNDAGRQAAEALRELDRWLATQRR